MNFTLLIIYNDRLSDVSTKKLILNVTIIHYFPGLLTTIMVLSKHRFSQGDIMLFIEKLIPREINKMNSLGEKLLQSIYSHH